MKRNLIIQSSPQGLDIALLEDDLIVEFHQDLTDKDYLVGDVYLGKVKKILPGLNAAFIDIGYERNGFLHFNDLGYNFLKFNNYTQNILSGKITSDKIKSTNQPEIHKNGELSHILKPDYNIVVQIIKEPISTKGHRLTTQITLAGRYIVLIPFSEGITVSKRIRDRKEKKRLISIFQDLKPENFGVIIRTAAEGLQSHILEKDLNTVYSRWQEIVLNLGSHRQKLLSEYNKATSILRDMLNETFDSIIVNDKKTFDQLQTYLESISDSKKKLLRLHKDKTPPFEVYNVEKQIRSLFGKIINFGKGGYLIIEHTEAMHVIDVNSGSKISKDTNREETVLNINMDAAVEIARQLRLRDLGGLIIIDFIDMKRLDNQKALFEKMKELLSRDRSQHSVLPISKFGLMEITRQRVKPEIKLSISESCPVCRGTGELKPTLLVVDDIENSIMEICKETKVRYLSIKTHPFVYTYLKWGFPSKRLRWMLKYKIWISLKASEAYHLINYKIFDFKGKDIEEVV